MTKPKIPFNKPSIRGNELKYIKQAILHGQISGDGHFTKLCSDKLIEMTCTSSALLTHSCTAALEMAAILCDLQPGDEVIMPSFTFVSTANAVVLRKAVPVFVDIDSKTLNLNPDMVVEAITSRTRAIFVVHYAGIPAEMDRLSQIANANDLMLIEDAAQALGSTYKGRKVGSLGDMAAFSFHETKNIVSGEGGALVFTRPDLVERGEIIRQKGTNRSKFMKGEVDKYTWIDLGSSYLPGELVAAFLYGQLQEADAIKEKRLHIFDQYCEAFHDLAATGRIGVPHIPKECTGNGHMFYLLMKDLTERDNFIQYMQKYDITSPHHYVPLHSSPAGERFGRSHGELPITNEVSDKLIRLPNYCELGTNIDFIIDKARSYLVSN